MPVQKEHAEFHAVDMERDGWAPPSGYPPDIEQKILSGALDENNRTGSRTRLLRFKPGAFTSKASAYQTLFNVRTSVRKSVL